MFMTLLQKIVIRSIAPQYSINREIIIHKKYTAEYLSLI